MDKERKFFNSELVYESHNEDESLCVLPLKWTNCTIYYSEAYELSPLDKLICSILSNKERNELSYISLGLMLGFDLDNDNNKHYKDEAEVELYKSLIKEVEEWGLVKIEQNGVSTITLTNFGEKALSDNKKYKLYRGNCKLISFQGLKNEKNDIIHHFPFKQELNTKTSMSDVEMLEYNDVNYNIFTGDRNDDINIEDISLQLEPSVNIYNISLSPYFEILPTYVEVKLYKDNDSYIPVPYKNGQLCNKLFDIWELSPNKKFKDIKIEWALYCRLLHDDHAILNFNTLSPFFDIIDFSKILSDSRLNWKDSELLDYIISQANEESWHQISKYCDLKTLESLLDKYKDKLDWILLTERYDSGFIAKNSRNYPWDITTITSTSKFDKTLVEKFIKEYNFPEGKDNGVWDWDELLPKLDFVFISDNIGEIPFALYSYTRTQIEFTKRLLIQSPEASWDWSYISSNYDLGYILNNFDLFSKYLQPQILERAFMSNEYVRKYVSNKFVQKTLLNDKPSWLGYFHPNQENYIWTYDLIDILEKGGYITWSSQNYIDGFECNPYINWNYEFFSRYKNKIATNKGFNHLSACISDENIINDNIDFNWNWEIISRNKQIIKDTNFVQRNWDKLDKLSLLQNLEEKSIEEIYPKVGVSAILREDSAIRSYLTKKLPLNFIKVYQSDMWDWQYLSTIKDVAKDSDFIYANKNKLNIESLVENMSGVVAEQLFDSLNLSGIMKENLNVQKRITELTSIDFLRSHIKCSWDWSILTQKVCKIINLKNMGLPSWIDKWDWDYLSENLDISDIENYLEEYKDRWNWEILLRRLKFEDLETNDLLDKISSIINNFDDEKNKSLWSIITSKYDFNQLESKIEVSNGNTQYHWNYLQLYNDKSFNSLHYLKEHTDLISWDYFSESDAANKIFKYDNSISFSLWIRMTQSFLKDEKYKWNLKRLSHLPDISVKARLFETRTEEWDWEYLSANAIFLKIHNEKPSYFISKFKKFIDFSKFSKRTDAGINEKLIEKYKKYNWDWNALIENPSIKFSFKYIDDHIDKPWNWKKLSSRSDLEFDFVKKYPSKNWDWSVLSSRDIFKPSVEILSNVQDISVIDWYKVSDNEEISIDVVEKYPQLLDWHILSKNTAINFANIDIAEKFKNYIDWEVLTSKYFKEISIDYLIKMKSYIPWGTYNKLLGNHISTEMVLTLYDVLDWRYVSQSLEIKYSQKFVNKFKDKWYWSLLVNNEKFKEDIPNYRELYPEYYNYAIFVNRLASFDGRRPAIFHFTHFYNAIEVIKEKKILSRDRAKSLKVLKGDSAGSVISRSKLAHKFARFYFRPETPTQYYNEALGVDSFITKEKWISETRSWEQVKDEKKIMGALRLGKPKCPVPVFFKFDLDEVLSKMGNKCHYSDRNMQSDYPNVYKVEEHPEYIEVDDIYRTMEDAYKTARSNGDYNRAVHEREMNKILRYSQQEFLVEDEFDFSQLQSYEIVCYDEEYCALLKSIFADDHICEKIHTDFSNEFFERENRRIEFRQCQEGTETHCSIKTNFLDNHYLRINSPELDKIQIVLKDGDKPISEDHNELKIRDNIEWIKTNVPMAIYFVDPEARTTDWLIYSNGYTQSNDINLVDETICNDFLKATSSLSLHLSKSLFYPMMINSYHGIGHTTRVVFATFLIDNALRNELTQEEKKATLYAAIIHDLGKHDDREGEIHGYNSMKLYENKLDNIITDKSLRDRVLNAVRYHSVDDSKCPSNVQNDIIWKILKDADALDRSRFRGKGCDKSYLRLNIFNEKIGEKILYITKKLPYLTEDLNWNSPYIELINAIQNK